MKLLIITGQESELSRLMKASFDEVTICTPENMLKADMESYDAIAMLAGADCAEPLLTMPWQRRALDRCVAKGIKVFTEFVAGVADVDGIGNENTRFARPICLDASPLGVELEKGLLFEEQSNTRMVVRPTGREYTPILQYQANPRGFYVMENVEEMKRDETKYALWTERENLLVCSFRMSNFASAKFSPQRIWATLISGVVNWLGGKCTEEMVLEILKSAYHMRGESCSPLEAAEKAMAWLENAGMLVEQNGEFYAVREGLKSHVRPDGEHVLFDSIRPDGVGESAMMYYFKYLLDGDRKAQRLAEQIMSYPRDMQVTEGPMAGWESWGLSCPFALYQDDAARGLLLPELWYALLSGDQSHLPSVRLTLDYLISTTGTDGLRMCRTDYKYRGAEKLKCTATRREPGKKWNFVGVGEYTPEELRNMPSGCPTAHYNATYMAALLLYCKVTGERKYYEVARRGLRTMMEYYPETAREHSETQELCRLILPMALLCWVSEDEEEKSWLYRITEDLTRLRHECGGYREWDTGYIATCAGVAGGESSVLAANGDPVADMLYSLNWLPMGFAAAYLATKDEYFRALWQGIADFFTKSQIISDNKRIDGIWPRSMDMDRFEVYGVPNDVGWAPWSVESGWTISEIAAGLILGTMMDKIEI